MNRPAIAFIVAPLWVPVLVAPYAAVFVFPYPAQGHWVVFSIFVSAIFSYGAMLAFGLPAFLILRSRQITNLWIAAILGSVFGAVTWIVFRVCFALFLGEGSAGARLALRFTAVDAAWLLPPSLLGLIIGVTFWLIARPDRTQARA